MNDSKKSTRQEASTGGPVPEIIDHEQIMQDYEEMRMDYYRMQEEKIAGAVAGMGQAQENISLWNLLQRFALKNLLHESAPDFYFENLYRNFISNIYFKNLLQKSDIHLQTQSTFPNLLQK